MNKAICILAALGIIAGLCSGCGEADKPEPEAMAQPKEVPAEKWEPETAKQHEAHSEHDGHDHSAHDGHDHSGHDDNNHNEDAAHDAGGNDGHNHSEHDGHDHSGHDH